MSTTGFLLDFSASMRFFLSFSFSCGKKRLLEPWCTAELSTYIYNSQKHFNEPIILWRERTSVKRGKVYKGLHKRYELLSQLLLQYQNDNSFQEYTQPLKINFKISLRKYHCTGVAIFYRKSGEVTFSVSDYFSPDEL